MSTPLRYIIVVIAGYLLGSICVGMIVSRRKGQDIREVGSKSAGASNVLRTLGMRSGAITFVGDFFKVLIASLLGLLLIGQEGAMAGGLVAVIGHNWPVFYGFRGGKGVAGSAAAMLVVFPIEALIAIALCIAVIYLTRYISLGSMVLLTSYALLVCILHWGWWSACIWSILMAALCILRHRSNIQRLIAGTERKLSFKGAKK